MCIACFQETPQSFDGDQAIKWSSGKLKILSGIEDDHGLRSKHVTFVGTSSLEVDPEPSRNHQGKSANDTGQRCQGLTISCSDAKWANLQVLGIHGIDRFYSSSEKERTRWARLMRDVLGSFWRGGPLVVLGDLNANPFHDEITDRDGLYALRKKDGLMNGLESKLRLVETRAVALYNPMWQLLPDSAAAASGTYYHQNRTGTELLWHCIDQIIMSVGLEPYLVNNTLQILTYLLGDKRVELLDGDVPVRVKNVPIYSDHLPVQLAIDIGQVEQCRISEKP